jgi:ABC-type transporter MlaC component
MSAVLILTPVVIASWPAITAAAAGAAAAMGLAVHSAAKEEARTQAASEEARQVNTVEVEMTNSTVTESVAAGQQMVLTRGNVTLRVGRDARGRCTVCATGKGHSKAELKAIAEEFSQRLTQCYAYNRVMSELKARNFQVVNQEKMEDGTVRVHVRRWEA